MRRNHSGSIRSRVRRFARSGDAAALAELAVVFPLLLLFAIGVADFGRVYFTAIRVTNAARAGAQYAYQNNGLTGNTTGIQAAARNDAGDQTLTVTSTTYCRCPGNVSVSCSGTCTGYGMPQYFVQVTASKNVAMIIKQLGLPTNITVQRTVTFRAQ